MLSLQLVYTSPRERISSAGCANLFGNVPFGGGYGRVEAINAEASTLRKRVEDLQQQAGHDF